MRETVSERARIVSVISEYEIKLLKIPTRRVGTSESDSVKSYFQQAG